MFWSRVLMACPTVLPKGKHTATVRTSLIILGNVAYQHICVFCCCLNFLSFLNLPLANNSFNNDPSFIILNIYSISTNANCCTQLNFVISFYFRLYFFMVQETLGKFFNDLNESNYITFMGEYIAVAKPNPQDLLPQTFFSRKCYIRDFTRRKLGRHLWVTQKNEWPLKFKDFFLFSIQKERYFLGSHKVYKQLVVSH